MAQGFDAPPPLERSGSEHRRAVTSFPLMVKGKAWFRIKDPPSREGQEGLFAIHLLIILLILPRSNMIYTFLVLEIPFYGLLDTLLKQERWLPTEFLRQLSRIDGVTHIKNRKRMSIQYFPSIYVLSKKKDGMILEEPPFG